MVITTSDNYIISIYLLPKQQCMKLFTHAYRYIHCFKPPTEVTCVASSFLSSSISLAHHFLSIIYMQLHIKAPEATHRNKQLHMYLYFANWVAILYEETSYLICYSPPVYTHLTPRVQSMIGIITCIGLTLGRSKTYSEMILHWKIL